MLLAVLLAPLLAACQGAAFVAALGAEPPGQDQPGVSIYSSPTPRPSSDYELPPGVTPREAITGSRSGSSPGRAENPWDTHSKPRREDELD